MNILRNLIHQIDFYFLFCSLTSREAELESENDSLRSRLRNVVQSPLSDAEKQQMIDEDSRQHHHSVSAPASISMTLSNVCLKSHVKNT